MTLVKEKNSQWTQLEKVDDINAGGSEMFRKIGINDEPQRTLSFFAPSRFKDYWEHDSEVPISPFPEPEDAIQSVEWSEDDAEEIEDMEQQVENQDIEKLVIAKHPHEVELDETMFSEKTSVKDLQMACKERNLPYAGSKKRLLERLMNFKINIETQMQLVNRKQDLQGATEDPNDHRSAKASKFGRARKTLHYTHALCWMVSSLCSKSERRKTSA